MSQTAQERDEQVLHGGKFTTEANFNWLPLRDLEAADEPTGNTTKVIDLLRPVNRINKTDVFTTTSAKVYTLTKASDILYPQEIRVTLGGVPQIPGVDYSYSVDNNSITLVEVPPLGIKLSVTYLMID